MNNADIQLLNETLFNALENAPSPLVEEAADTINLWTRKKMWTLWHIPFKYYLPPEKEPTTELEQLYRELATHGEIALDRSGEPCCLSGRRPALLHIYPDLHGPWKEEPNG